MFSWTPPDCPQRGECIDRHIFRADLYTRSPGGCQGGGERENIFAKIYTFDLRLHIYIHLLVIAGTYVCCYWPVWKGLNYLFIRIQGNTHNDLNLFSLSLLESINYTGLCGVSSIWTTSRPNGRLSKECQMVLISRFQRLYIWRKTNYCRVVYVKVSVHLLVFYFILTKKVNLTKQDLKSKWSKRGWTRWPTRGRIGAFNSPWVSVRALVQEAHRRMPKTFILICCTYLVARWAWPFESYFQCT